MKHDHEVWRADPREHDLCEVPGCPHRAAGYFRLAEKSEWLLCSDHYRRWTEAHA